MRKIATFYRNYREIMIDFQVHRYFHEFKQGKNSGKIENIKTFSFFGDIIDDFKGQFLEHFHFIHGIIIQMNFEIMHSNE